MEILIFMLILAAFALAAYHWGCDSREVTPSPDWKKHRQLQGLTSYRHL